MNDNAADLRLGESALERGFITSAQLEGARAEQDEARKAGGPTRPLAEILLARGYITPAQAAQLGMAPEPPALRKRSDNPAAKPPGTRRAVAKPPPLGKYTLSRELGHGGKGVVYEALDTVLSRKVALKMILPEHVKDEKELEAEGRRFLTEARISANLPKHPHIVGVYEAGQIEGKHYLAMELVEGQPLLRWRRNAAFEAQVELVRDVALALHHGHEHGVIHRDVKPQNILVDGQGRPRLTDYGLAKLVGAKEDLAAAKDGRVWGTPSHMSPEHARGLAVDARTDVYSLGVLLYEALAGRPPFKGDTPSELLDKVVHDPVPPVGRFVDPSTMTPLHKAVESVCLRALAKEPGKRHATAQALADDLTSALLGAAGVKSRKPILVGGIAAGVLAAAAVLFFALRSGEDPQAKAAEAQRLQAKIDSERKAAVERARFEAEERARREREELEREAERKRLKDEEAQALLKVELIKGAEATRAAEERARAAEEARRKAEEELKKPPTPEPVKPATPEPAPKPATPVPAPNPAVPVPPAPVVVAPTGEPRALEGGVLHFEAEDFTGGEKPVQDVDYHDTTPGNSGGGYRRTQDVDIAALTDGEAGFWVGAFQQGEWMRYRFQGGGRLQFEVRYSGRNPAGLKLEIDGVPVERAVALPPLPGKRLWTTTQVTLAAIPAGTHELKLHIDTPPVGIDWFRLKPFVPVPVPEAAKLKEAEKAIQEAFRADYAKRTPADQAALAKKLLAEAAKVPEDPLAQYTMLSESREAAVAGGDVAGAFAAIDELDQVFAVDATALRLEALAAAVKAARTPDAARAVAEAHLPLIEAAVDKDDFEQALQLGSKAESAAKAAQNPGLVQRVQGRAKEIAALRDEHSKLKASIKALEANPNDAAASLSVGTYHCFSKGDWAKGVPLLAKGSDPVLAALAQKEAAAPVEPADQSALGDAWREAGEKKPGALKGRYFGRALHWYEKALPALTGLARLKTEGHLEGLYKVVGGDGLKRGLVFWVEPASAGTDPLRELTQGGKYLNTQGALSTVGTKALQFQQRSWVDYAANEAVKAVDRAGSMFGWVRSDFVAQMQGSIVNRGDDQLRQDDFALMIANRGRLFVFFNLPEARQSYSSRGTVPQSQWTLVGATWDEKEVTLYIDGHVDSVLPVQPMALPQRRTSKMTIGCDNPGSPDQFLGLIGSVMVYNRPLTSAEAAALYYGTRAKFR
jgi:hypothetical protein